MGMGAIQTIAGGIDLVVGAGEMGAGVALSETGVGALAIPVGAVTEAVGVGTVALGGLNMAIGLDLRAKAMSMSGSGGGTPSGPKASSPPPRMLGERGTKTMSTRLWRGTGKERLDVENPNPGQRPGQIHYQDPSGAKKYLYDPATKSFPMAPRGVNEKLSDEGFQKAIQKGLRILGED
jgi:filamentous hemagglutinin